MSTRTQQHRQQEQQSAATRESAQRRTQRVTFVVGAVVVSAVIAVMMLTSRPSTSTVVRTAPDFTLTDTAGDQVSLADFRGRNVVLYFSEGAGCGACIQQMAAIERDRAAFAAADVTVLPIVMNGRADILRDMSAYGARTPFLLDDGTVSKAYGTLGKGMHAGLPGHSFVLVDKSGTQRWYGEYPSMWLAPDALLDQVRRHLAA
jgi:peroxiredoxin